MIIDENVGGFSAEVSVEKLREKLRWSAQKKQEIEKKNFLLEEKKEPS